MRQDQGTRHSRRACLSAFRQLDVTCSGAALVPTLLVEGHMLIKNQPSITQFLSIITLNILQSSAALLGRVSCEHYASQLTGGGGQGLEQGHRRQRLGDSSLSPAVARGLPSMSSTHLHAWWHWKLTQRKGVNTSNS